MEKARRSHAKRGLDASLPGGDTYEPGVRGRHRMWLMESLRFARQFPRRGALGGGLLRRPVRKPGCRSQKSSYSYGLEVQEVETRVPAGHVDHGGNGRPRVG